MANKKTVSKTEQKKKAACAYNQQDFDFIKKRAYIIWEMKGKPSNTAVNDWLEAERQLKEEGLI